MRVEGISCPHCTKLLPSQLIHELVDASLFAKYRMLLRNIEIQKNPNLKWCPNPKCSVVVKAAGSKKTSKCPKCQTLICNKCNREGHSGKSCEGAFQKEIEDW